LLSCVCWDPRSATHSARWIILSLASCCEQKEAWSHHQASFCPKFAWQIMQVSSGILNTMRLDCVALDDSAIWEKWLCLNLT
jgi:hypothetical protein